MRASAQRGGRKDAALFGNVDFEARVPAHHPLLAMRSFANAALSAMAGDLLVLRSGLSGRVIAPEKLRAMLLQALYSIRSERQLMERLEFDLLFRWLVGLSVDDACRGSLDPDQVRDGLFSEEPQA